MRLMDLGSGRICRCTLVGVVAERANARDETRDSGIAVPRWRARFFVWRLANEHKRRREFLQDCKDAT